MAKATFLWLIVYFGSIPLAFINPVFGLLAYLFEYYLRPSLHWWGSNIPDWRWSLIISVVTLVSFLIRRPSLPAVAPVRNSALKWVFGLGLIMLVVTPGAVNVQESWSKVLIFWKLIALYAVIIGILRTTWAFDAFVAMHIAGATWWGWEAYLDPQREAGRLINLGSSDTLNDNLAAGHLLTVLPFIVLFLFASKEWPKRVLAIVAAPLVVNTFILCNSRGATVGMLVAMVAALCLARRGMRLKLVAVGTGAVAVFLLLADPIFIARQLTTMNYEQESTAVSRMDSWEAGLQLIQDYPFGAGGNGFEELSPIYIPDIVASHEGEKRAPHNTYVQIAGDWGIPGLTLFLGFIGSTFVILHRIRAQSHERDAFYYRSFAIEVGLIGTLAAGVFADRAYGESIYWLCALAVSLSRLQATAALERNPTITENATPSVQAVFPGSRSGYFGEFVRQK